MCGGGAAQKLGQGSREIVVITFNVVRAGLMRYSGSFSVAGLVDMDADEVKEAVLYVECKVQIL